MPHVPFNRPQLAGNELRYIEEAVASRYLSAGGAFTHRCEQWLEQRTGASQALLVHSCTAALELVALLLDVGPGDEIVMPSFTFVSTANAFALRGATPVFVDIRADTLNIDERLVEDAITDHTRAIVAVHYAGVPAAMAELRSVATNAGVVLVEDAAQALLSSYEGTPAGALADLATISFHETKNLIAGEGGALLLRDDRWRERAVILRDKGTDRSRFLRGEVDRYTWVDLGSSYGPSELNAAFLAAQLEEADRLIADRRRTWQLYFDALADLEQEGLLRRPVVPPEVEHNAHLFYVLLAGGKRRDDVLAQLAQRDVNAIFHYVPLHSSAAGRRLGRVHGSLTKTDEAYARLIRLPLWAGMPEADAERVVEALGEILRD